MMLLPGSAEADVRTSPARVSPFPGEPTYYGGSICNGIQRYTRPINAELVQGEPLFIELLLQSLATSGVEHHDFSARLQYGEDLRVFITPPNGRTFEYRPMRVNPLSPGTVIQMLPGEFVSMHLVLAYDPESLTGALFEEPGNYQVRLTLECRDSRTARHDTGTEIGTMTVRVGVAESESDRALGSIVGYDYHEFFRAFQFLRPQNARDIGIMERLLEIAPESVHAPLASFSLATEKFDKAFAFMRPGGSEEEKDMDAAREARRMLEDFKERYPDHVLVGMAQQRLFRLALLFNDDEEAFELFREAWVDPRMTSMLLRRGSEYRWMFGDQEEPDPPVQGEWTIFVDPMDGMDPSIYRMEDEVAGEMTEEEAMRAAVMEAIREGRVEVHQMEGPPPGYE